MAGETPGASRAGKQRTRLKFGDDKGTGKYYASNQPSVINNTQADSRGRIGSKPQPIATPQPKLDERSADKKYYASPSAPKGTRPPQRRLLGAPVELAQETQDNVAALKIERDSEVNPVMDEVVRRLSGGEAKVIVTVAEGSPSRRARTKLDSLVTRQILTEEQARDVTFSKLPVKERPPKAERLANMAMEQSIETLLAAPPTPTATKSLDDDEPLDIDSILSGDGASLEDVVDTTPQNVAEAVVEDDEGDEQETVKITEPEEAPIEPPPVQTQTEVPSPDESPTETVTPPTAAPAAADEDVDGDGDGDDE